MQWVAHFPQAMLNPLNGVPQVDAHVNNYAKQEWANMLTSSDSKVLTTKSIKTYITNKS